MKLKLLALSIAVTLSGCTLAPKYQQPDAPFAAAWEQQAQHVEQMPDWQMFFQDENLHKLIETALEHNRDLRVAALNVEAFAAQYRIQRSELYPSLDASGGGSRQRIPANMSPDKQRHINGQYNAGVGINAWEADFFGRIRSLKDSALQSFFASEQAQRGAELSLIAGVASAWMLYQSDLALLGLAESTLAAYEDSLRLVSRSHEAGIASALELQQSKTAADNARVNVAQYQRESVQSRNALQLILGAPLPELNTEENGLMQIKLAELPLALPSELLQRRPDILQAEFQLKAANANIGAARAAFFPSVSLTATAGSMSDELSGLFKSGSGTWLFKPQINLPIFNAGRLRASLDYSKIQKDIRIAQYENTIQTAFQEVANGLTARATFAEQLQAQQQLLKSSSEYLDLASKRYREGIDNQLTMLDAQRMHFASQQQYIITHMQKLNSEIELYKALGGGFEN